MINQNERMDASVKGKAAEKYSHVFVKGERGEEIC